MVLTFDEMVEVEADQDKDDRVAPVLGASGDARRGQQPDHGDVSKDSPVNNRPKWWQDDEE